MFSYVKVPIAIVSFVDSSGRMSDSRCGFGLHETHSAIDLGSRVLVISDVARDLRFSSNRFVTGPPYIRFYACAPITIDDILIGNLCIIDTVPRFDFDLSCQTNLTDIAYGVSGYFRGIQENKLRTNSHKAKSTRETAEIAVPIPYNEGYRLRVLRETGLLDSTTNDHYFDNITCLCQRLFKVRIYLFM